MNRNRSNKNVNRRTTSKNRIMEMTMNEFEFNAPNRFHEVVTNNRRKTKEIYANQRPVGFNYVNIAEEPTAAFNMNAPVRIHEVLNASRYQINKTRKYKNVQHATERPLKLVTRIPTNTRKQVRSVRQMQQLQQIKPPTIQRLKLNTIAEGTPKTPLPFRTSSMPNTPNPANYNLIFGKKW